MAETVGEFVEKLPVKKTVRVNIDGQLYDVTNWGTFDIDELEERV